MTGTTRSSDGLDARRRKLLFRSWHRGIREMDLILGQFADDEIERLTDEELDQYERLLEEQDADLLTFFTGGRSVTSSDETAVLAKIVAHRAAVGS